MIHFKKISIGHFWARLAGILLTLMFILISLWNPIFLGELRDEYFDALIRYYPPSVDQARIVVVDVDSKSLAEEGQWPWPRDRIAELLSKVTASGPVVVGLDMVFAEPDRSSSRNLVGENNLDQPPDIIREYLEKLPDHDFEFAKVLYFSPVPIIMGHVFRNDDIANSEQKVPRQGQFVLSGDDPTPFLLRFNQVDMNLEMFERTSQGSGFFNIIPDSDGIVRREPLLIVSNGILYPSLILSMIQAAEGADILVVETNQDGIRSVQVGSYRIPCNSDGQFIVNYGGPAYTFDYISAHDILSGTFDSAPLQGAYVLFGASAPGLYDTLTTPTSQFYPGVEIHANALNTILGDYHLIRPEWSKGAEVIYLLLTGIFLTIFLPSLRAVWGAFFLLLLAGAIVVFSIWNFHYENLLVDIVYPLFTTFSFFTILTFLNFLLVERKANRIRSSFSQYLSPTLVKELVDNQDSLVLKGENRELTILFSDIRAFTSMSEKMSPEDLCTFLNEYLTPMTTLVMEQRGTIDKFIGDAVMAFWNAPLMTKDHVYHACVCAIQMIEGLQKLNSSWGKKGFPPITIGIGVHVGVARVGNMGSRQRFDYTVMGDTVNLCSRLEGLNKMYGTNILVSSSVYDELRSRDLCFRKVDSVRVKGKNKPVTVYELIGYHAGEIDAHELQMHNKALNVYECGDFATARRLFSTLRQNYPQTQLYGVYEKRCHHFEENAPENWDGIIELTSK